MTPGQVREPVDGNTAPTGGGAQGTSHGGQRNGSGGGRVMRRHELDAVSLVFGLLFLGVAALWGFSGDTLLRGPGWRLPLLLIGVGVGGLAVSLLAGRGRRS